MSNPKMPAPPRAVANPRLVAAAAKLKEENNPTTLNAVINELVRGTYLVPARIDLSKNMPKPDATGKIQLPKNTQINFLLLNTKDGKKYFMAFTDWEQFHKWSKDSKQTSIVLRFDDFAGLLERNGDASGLVLNPFGENLRFEKAMIASIKKQKDEIAKQPQLQKKGSPIKPGDKVTIVEPTTYPDALVDPICELLAKNETVASAYLQIMVVNDDKKSYLLVLDGPKDDSLFADIAQAAKPFLMNSEKKMDLNMTISASPLGQQGMRGSEPFYLKGTGRVPDDDDDE